MLNGNTLLFDLSNVAGTSDLVATTKTNVVNSANIIVLNAPTGAVPAGGYTLMTYTAKTGSGTLTFPNGTTNMYNAVLTNGPTGVTLGVLTGGLTGQDTWQGNASGVWDNSAANWVKNGTGSSNYAAGDAVTFDDTASGNFTVSSVSTVSPASVLVPAHIAGARIGHQQWILIARRGRSPLAITNHHRHIVLGVTHRGRPWHARRLARHQRIHVVVGRREQAGAITVAARRRRPWYRRRHGGRGRPRVR